MTKRLGEIIIKGKRVFVRELEVAEVDALLIELDTQHTPTTLDWLFADDYMPESALEKIIGQPVKEVLAPGIAPSELEPLYKKAVEVNPFFAKALEKMRGIADLMRTLGLNVASEEELRKELEKSMTDGSAVPGSS